MGLDIRVVDEVWGGGIPHTFAEMANVVKLSNKLTLMDVLWYPDDYGLFYSSQIEPLLVEALKELQDNESKYSEFNLWDNYSSLIHFVDGYKDACQLNPNARIQISV